MKISNRFIRNAVFVVLSLLIYLAWSNGFDRAYGKFVAGGISNITSKFSSIERAQVKYYEEEKTSIITCKYEDRTTKINLEYCLPVVLLLAWQLSLFFDKRLRRKDTFKLLAINFLIVYFLQIIFPLLLFNVSQSKFKSTSLFIGMQIFSFIVFFLILKDSLMIKYIYSQKTNTPKKR